jgi:hypothetical protein
MTKQDKIFIFLILISLTFITMVITQNLSAQSETPLAAKKPADMNKAATTYDPAQAESVRKKFEAMGLKPHEGKYWK